MTTKESMARHDDLELMVIIQACEAGGNKEMKQAAQEILNERIVAAGKK